MDDGVEGRTVAPRDAGEPSPRIGAIAVATRPFRLAFLILLCFWLASPFVMANQPAQDGPAFAAAAKLVGTRPDAVYGSRWHEWAALPGYEDHADEWTTWLAAYCEADPQRACVQSHAGFLSPPPALIPYLASAPLGPDAALLLIRIFAVLPLVIGMEILWRMMRSRGAATAKMVVVATALVTPTVINIVTLGQNTGILFLAVCLGGAAMRRNRFDGLVVAAGVAYSAAIMFKMWPALAVLVLLVRRRWHLLGATAAVGLTWLLVAQLTLPSDLWDGFLAYLGPYRSWSIADGFNRSVDATLHATIWPGLNSGLATTITLLVRLGLLGALWVRRVRRFDAEIQWCFAWLAAIILSDYVWPHYLIVLLPAAAWVMDSRGDESRWLMPAGAALALVSLATWSNPGIGHVLTVLALALSALGLALLPRVRSISPDGRSSVGVVDAAV